MRIQIVKIKKLVTASLALILAPMVYAEGDLSRANVQTVVLEMGNYRWANVFQA